MSTDLQIKNNVIPTNLPSSVNAPESNPILINASTLAAVQQALGNIQLPEGSDLDPTTLAFLLLEQTINASQTEECAPAEPADAAPAAATSCCTPAAPAVSSSGLPAGTYASLNLAVSMAAGAISKMTSLTGQSSAEMSSINAKMGQGMEQVYLAQATQAYNDLQKSMNEGHWHKMWGAVGSHLGTIIAVTVIVAAIATQQYEIAGAVVATMVCKMIAPEMSSGIADICTKCGMSPEAAAIVGKATTDLIIAAAAVAAGQVGAAFEEGEAVGEVAEKAGTKAVQAGEEEAGTELTDIAAEGAESLTAGGESDLEMSTQRLENQTDEEFNVEKPEKTFLNQVKEVASEAAETLKKVGSTINKANPFSYTPTFVNEFAFGLAQGWMTTGTTNAILQATGNDSMKTMIIADSITDVLGLLVSGAAIGGMASETRGAKELANTPKNLLRATQFIQYIAGIGQVTAEANEAVWSGKMAKTSENYAEVQSEMDRTQFALNVVAQDNQLIMQNYSRNISEGLKEIKGLYDSLTNAMGAPL
ncbi:MAG: hypothetical protein KF898_03195 [Parachlamydiales bacterium]|nr:hypothetical protein [Verrucomicrobiota bacterium]MBX3718639.1 hypothetical protein [Candidatus Acheromyda pituitae]